MTASAASYDAYKRVDIETASQGKLIVMLFNGAITRAEDAKRAIEDKDLPTRHNKLIGAQNIIAELRAALNMNAGELSANLDQIYEYAHHLLVQANIKSDPRMIDESVKLLTSMRDTWQELFESVAVSESSTPPPAPPINQHGASRMNLQG